MASAYECDRCGTLFKRSSLIEPHKSKITVFMEEASPYPGEDAPKRLDLCPKCLNDLGNWLREPEKFDIKCNKEE